MEIKRGVCFKLAPVYNAFLHDLKLSGYRIQIQFNKNIIVVEENNYPTKFVNAYIVYDLDDWQKFPLNDFKLKSWLFVATNIVIQR